MRNSKVLIVDVTQDLGHQVERVTTALHPHPEVVLCDDLDAARSAINDQGPFDVLVAGSSVSTQSGLRELRRVRTSAPQTRLILAFDHWRGSGMRDIVRTGALDILRLPVDDGVLLEAVEWAMSCEPVLTSGTAQVGDPGAKGSVTTIVSATGGCGKTFLTTNLGYHLRKRFQGRICLVDLDLQFGELSTALRLTPKRTIADLVSRGAGDIDLGSQLDDYLACHDTDVHVLAAPAQPAQADGIGAADAARVIDVARSRFDHVILDTSTALSEPMLASLDCTDQIFVVVTLDMPSVRNLSVLLRTFEQLKVPAEKTKLVMNKVEHDVGLDVGRVTEYFARDFDMVIPYGREVNRSLNMGQPVLAYAPRSEVSKAVAAGLTQSVATYGVERGVQCGTRRVPWRRAFRSRQPTA